MLVLKCKYGDIGILDNNNDRIISCIEGSNLCPKPENQGQFDNNCFLNVEVVKNER